ncbi:MAG TPA: hypothetical protein VGR21_06540 [Cryptosporangiaceae bacterium]|nr:hypothetical protein [Cryptosporangiaceae bacterium]
MATNSGAPLVFPIGHYMGPFHPARHAAPQHYIVRVGWDTPKLPDEDHLNVWALTHGLPSQIASVPWDRHAILAAAKDAGMPGAEKILGTLLDLGVAAEVMPGTDQAIEFAQAYRMQSLLVGLGNLPDDPTLDGIGLPGVAPVVRVRPRVYELWQWGHLWPSLWATCEALAEVAREVAAETDDADPAESEPEQVLDFALESLRTLVAHNAAYLDVAHTAAESPA